MPDQYITLLCVNGPLVGSVITQAESLIYYTAIKAEMGLTGKFRWFHYRYKRVETWLEYDGLVGDGCRT